MTPAPFASLSVACSTLVIALSGWNLWRIKFAHRARGRRAVERLLSDRGEVLVAIKELPISALRSTSGFAGAVVFQVSDARYPNIKGSPLLVMKPGVRVGAHGAGYGEDGDGEQEGGERGRGGGFHR